MSKTPAHHQPESHGTKHHVESHHPAHHAEHAPANVRDAAKAHLVADTHILPSQRRSQPTSVRANFTPDAPATNGKPQTTKPDGTPRHIDITPIQSFFGVEKTPQAKLTAQLDPTKDAHTSVEQMIKSGKFVDKQNHAVNDHSPAGPSNVVPKIKLVLADQTADPSHAVQPDLVVKTIKGPDGKNHTSIEVHNDFEKHPKAEIVVQIDRASNQLEPTKEQKEAALKLKTYLESRIKALHPEVAKQNVSVTDNQGALPHTPNTPAEQVPQQRMAQFQGAGSGNLSRQQADSYFPAESNVPRQVAPQQLDPVQVAKDVFAGLFNPDKQNPYETIRQSASGNAADDRYGFDGFNEDQMLFGLTAEVGDPPDPSKVAALEQQMHMKPGSLIALMSKLKNHQHLAASDLKEGLPKNLQDRIATRLASAFVEKAGGSVPLAALAVKLGKTPSNWLTQNDLANADNAKYMTAAGTMAQLSMARQVAGTNDNIPWKGVPSGAAETLARNAESIATHRDTIGRCYEAVAPALDTIGVHYYGGAAYMALDQARKDPRWVEIPLDQVRRGDLMVHSPTAGHVNGHIAIALGNDMEASDHVEHLIKRGAASHAFRLKDQQDNAG